MDSINHVASNEALTSVHSEKPWLNKKGHALSEHDLKEVSKDWDQETWEKYLNPGGRSNSPICGHLKIPHAEVI